MGIPRSADFDYWKAARPLATLPKPTANFDYWKAARPLPVAAVSLAPIFALHFARQRGM